MLSYRVVRDVRLRERAHVTGTGAGDYVSGEHHVTDTRLGIKTQRLAQPRRIVKLKTQRPMISTLVTETRG